MTSRSEVVLQTLIGLYLSAILFEKSLPDRHENKWCQLPVDKFKSSRSLEPSCNVPNAFSHLWELKKKTIWQLSLLEWLSRYRSKLLLRSDVEKNPGPAAAAADVTDSDKRKKFLTLIHVNSRSFIFVVLMICLPLCPCTECPHILALSETWLDSSVGDSEVHISGYTLFRFDHNRNGGGVAVYCADS